MRNEKAKCTSCGTICSRWAMFEINTGRRKQYQCPKCYIHGQYDTGKHSQIKKHVFGKMSKHE